MTNENVQASPKFCTTKGNSWHFAPSSPSLFLQDLKQAETLTFW